MKTKRHCDDKCCVDSGLEVTKKLVSVTSDFPTIGSPITLVYRIMLNNTSCKTIRCLDLQDSLYNQALFTTLGMTITAEAISCNSLTILTSDEILANGGHVLNVCSSFVKKCSVCTLQLTVNVANPGQLHLLDNVAIVEGKVKDGVYYNKRGKCRKKLVKIEPIVACSGRYTNILSFLELIVNGGGTAEAVSALASALE